MKRTWKQWSIIGLLLVFFVLTAAGCANGDSDSKEEEETKEVLYPVSINGTEIRIGETTVQALLDMGLKVTVSEMTEDNQINQYEVDPETELEANTYYTGGSVWITEHTFAHIYFVTGEESVKVGEAVLAYMEISLSSQDGEEELSKILFNGVPVTEISREKAGEMFPDFSGDDNMWFSPYTMKEYSYFMAFTEGMLYKLEVEKEYDVDWSSGN